MTPEQMLDLKMAEPPPGSVVRLRVGFEGSPKSYTYAALEAGSQWWITGRDGASGYSWSRLIDLLAHDGRTILSAETATAWENL